VLTLTTIDAEGVGGEGEGGTGMITGGGWDQQENVSNNIMVQTHGHTDSAGDDGRVGNKDVSVDGDGDGGKFSGEGANIEELRDGVEAVEIDDGVLDDVGVRERSDVTGVGEGTLGGSVRVEGTVRVEDLVVGTVTD
jgi:hypothetical protein